MRRLWILLAIPLILGCIGGGDADIEFAGCVPDGIEGVILTGFEPDLAQIYSDEDVTLTLEFENLGGSKATGIEAEIMNYAGLELSAGETVVQRISDMEVPEEGMPEVTEEADWTLEPAGSGSAGTETVSIAAALTYGYTSTGDATVKFIPTAEWRNMRQDGETVETAQSCSDGPLAVSVEPLRAPITEDSGEFTTRVVIANIGGGKVSTGAIDQLGDITLTLPAGFEVGSACDFTETVDATLVASGESLNRNGELVLTCKLMLDTDAVQIIREAEYEVKAVVEYDYIIDTTTSVSITQEASTLSMKLESPTGPTTWYTDKALAVKFEPVLGGTEICDDLEAEDFSVTIKNDLVKTQDVGTVTKIDCTDGVLELSIGYPAGADSKLTKAGELSVLTVDLSHEGKKASMAVDEIQVSDQVEPVIP